MKHYLKQFTAWVTVLTHNPFEKARLKLTLFYVGAMIVVIGLFSVVLIATLEKNLQDSLEDITGGNPAQHMAFIIAKDTVETVVYTIDSILILIIGGIGYFLAGRTLRPIQESLDRQKRFTADASHDLRTPLAIMKTEMEVALQDKHTNDSFYRKTIASNLEEVNKMTTLVSDLLLVARTERTVEKDTSRLVDVHECVDSVVKKMQIKAQEKAITLAVEGTIHGNIKVHLYSFERVVQNVLQNAINYTPSGGRVTVSIHKEKSDYTIRVTDTGVGISDADLPHIFERFYKASHSRNDASGSGLGLSIAKQIIEQHKGSIVVSSLTGKGTEVTIILPIA